ncbi:MAG: hypothetical protein ACLQJL_15325 [Roseiarcus sp.]
MDFQIFARIYPAGINDFNAMTLAKNLDFQASSKFFLGGFAGFQGLMVEKIWKCDFFDPRAESSAVLLFPLSGSDHDAMLAGGPAGARLVFARSPIRKRPLRMRRKSRNVQKMFL